MLKKIIRNCLNKFRYTTALIKTTSKLITTKNFDMKDFDKNKYFSAEIFVQNC